MNTIIIDKDNALLSFQKIIKLVSSGKRLELKIKENDDNLFDDAVKSNKIRSKLSILASKL